MEIHDETFNYNYTIYLSVAFRALAERLAVLIMLVVCAFCSQAMGQVTQHELNDRGERTNRGYAASPYIIDTNSNGYMLAVWPDHRYARYEFEGGEERSTAIFAQIFDAEFGPLGSNVRISAPVDSGSARLPDAVLLDDGRYVVVWNEAVSRPEGSGSVRRIVMTMRSLDGHILIPETTVEDYDPGVHVSSPTVHQLPGDRFLVTWSDSREGSSFRYGQYYFMDGSTDGPNIRLTPDGVTHSSIRIRAIDQNRYMMQLGEWLQLYSADHEPINDPVSIGVRRRIYPFNGDTLMVVFGDDLHFSKLYYQFLSADGSKLSPPVQITDAGAAGVKVDADVARNPEDGSYVIVWADGRNSAPLALLDIYAQRYDASGTPVGTNFKVNHESVEMGQSRPTIAYHRHNRFLVGWIEGRALFCNLPRDAVPGNFRNTFIIARFVDFSDPQPGPILGLENFLARCDPSQADFDWQGNFPNPFNSSTTMVFDVNTDIPVDVVITIVDVMGRTVKEMDSKTVVRGTYQVVLDALDLPAGPYFARLTSPQLPHVMRATTLVVVR